MAESTQIVFSHKEVTEALLKKQGIRQGIWGIYIKFGIKGANVGESPTTVMPAAIVPVLEIGIQKFQSENNLTVDAAKIGQRAARKKNKPKTPSKDVVH